MKFLVERFFWAPLTSPLLRLKYHTQESILKLSHTMSFSEQTELLLLKFNARQNPAVQFVYCSFFNKEKMLLENMLSEKCSGDCLNLLAPEFYI
jgi:hypothetical protein